MWSRRLVGSVEPTTPSAVWSRRLVGSVEPTTPSAVWSRRPRRQCGADDSSAVWSRRLVGVAGWAEAAGWPGAAPAPREGPRLCRQTIPRTWRRTGPTPSRRLRPSRHADGSSAPHSPHPAAFAHPAMPTGRRLHIPRIPPPSPIPPCRRVVGSSTFGAELISISRGSPAKRRSRMWNVVVNGGGRIEGDFGQLELGHRLQLQPDCWQVGFRRTIRRRGDPHSGGEAIKVTSYRDTKKQAAP